MEIRVQNKWPCPAGTGMVHVSLSHHGCRGLGPRSCIRCKASSQVCPPACPPACLSVHCRLASFRASMAAMCSAKYSLPRLRPSFMSVRLCLICLNASSVGDKLRARSSGFTAGLIGGLPCWGLSGINSVRGVGVASDSGADSVSEGGGL